MKIKFTLVVLLFACAFTAICPTLSSADDASHRQAVMKLLGLTAMQRKIEASVDNVLALQLRQSPALQAHEDVVRDFLEKYMGWEGLKEDIVAMYMQTFTEAELDEINAFYSTPAGQKLIARLPDLIQQRDRLAMQRLQEHAGELQQAIESSSSTNVEKQTP